MASLLRLRVHDDDGLAFVCVANVLVDVATHRGAERTVAALVWLLALWKRGNGKAMIMWYYYYISDILFDEE